MMLLFAFDVFYTLSTSKSVKFRAF